MREYSPRNRNRRNDDVPLSWSQQFYDSRPSSDTRPTCGFHILDGDK